MKLTTDEVLEKIGSFGRFQIVLSVLVMCCMDSGGPFLLSPCCLLRRSLAGSAKIRPPVPSMKPLASGTINTHSGAIFQGKTGNSQMTSLQ